MTRYRMITLTVALTALMTLSAPVFAGPYEPADAPPPQQYQSITGGVVEGAGPSAPSTAVRSGSYDRGLVEDAGMPRATPEVGAENALSIVVLATIITALVATAGGLALALTRLRRRRQVVHA